MAVEGEEFAVSLYPVLGCLGLVRRHRIAPNREGPPAEDPSRTLANHRESERSVDHTPHRAYFSARVSSCLAHPELYCQIRIVSFVTSVLSHITS